MINYYKYMPVSPEDESWGLYVLNAGCSRIDPLGTYPAAGHPSHHYFRWEQGRVFDEFQLIYIARGNGIFETRNGTRQVKEGTILMLFPQEWHRFRPNKESGWDELWVGFNGDIAQNLLQKKFISPDNPVIPIGVRDEVFRLFTDIIDITRTERAGYQALVSGTVMHLLGQIHSLSKEETVKQEDISEVLISRARIILRDNIYKNISIEAVADELQVGYSWFRKSFKMYTGIAPGQYLLQLKIDKAKMLLSDPTKAIKEIAFDLHFESAFYFSKIFKLKTGHSPEGFRKRMVKKVE